MIQEKNQPSMDDPAASLRLIEGMIMQAQQRFNENGFLYLLWGWVIFFSATGHFLLLHTNWVSHPEWIWTSCLLAVVWQIIFLARKSRRTTVHTYSDEMLKHIWIVFGIMMGLLSVNVAHLQDWKLYYALVLMLYGIPTFLSGVVLRFPALQIGAVICWMLSVATKYVPDIYILLLIAAAVVAAWIIPGYLLRARFKKQNN